jgi:hypothetical protein
MLAEDAGALAERRRRPVPDLALADRNLELVSRHCRRHRERSRDGNCEQDAGDVKQWRPSLMTVQRA